MSQFAIGLHYIAAYVVAAGDGDRCGLSELLTAIGTRHSEAGAEQIFESCVAACTTLVQSEHVRLEMTPAFASRPGRDGYVTIASDQVDATLRNTVSWESPKESHASYWLVATDTGKAAYISEEVVSL
jgi:hypothetical protein